jgi:hypothetical protein
MTAAEFEYGQMGGESAPIKVLRFAIFRAPVSTNAMYYRRSLNGKGKGLSLTREAVEFKDAVRSHALAAKLRSDWPMPDAVKHVAVKIVVWNTKHDCSAAEKLCLDGMEGVIYANDKVAHPRVNDINADGDGRPRVEITVELLRAV